MRRFLFAAFYFIWIFFLMPMVQAQEFPSLEMMRVNSGEAQYDGKEIVLVGQVNVQHSLGEISARRLCIQPASGKEKKNKLGLLKISENVHIKLEGGGELACEEAEVDYSKLEGVFLGNSASPDVIYTAEGSDDKNPQLMVKSTRMVVDLFREEAKTLVKQIHALQNLRINYRQEYLLHADCAVYQTIASEPSSPAGLLTLTMDGPNATCQLTTIHGDHVQAKKIQAATIERRLWLETPRGILNMHREADSPQTLEFEANELAWDDQAGFLHLKGKVNIIQNETLQVSTDYEISISQIIVNGQKTLRSIKAPQKVQVSYQDMLKGRAHKIICPGSLTIDHERQEIILQGSSDQSGKEEIQQVYIEDAMGEMYADYIKMNYSWENRQFTPKNILLEGHVRLLNRFDGHIQESGSVLHYALADRMDYFPKEQEIILAGSKDTRVLFFDKVNNVQMSAPSLKVKRDAETGKNFIQGLGDVRFTFMERELEQLKQHFRLEETSHKEP